MLEISINAIIERYRSKGCFIMMFGIKNGITTFLDSTLAFSRPPAVTETVTEEWEDDDGDVVEECIFDPELHLDEKDAEDEEDEDVDSIPGSLAGAKEFLQMEKLYLLDLLLKIAEQLAQLKCLVVLLDGLRVYSSESYGDEAATFYYGKDEYILAMLIEDEETGEERNSFHLLIHSGLEEEQYCKPPTGITLEMQFKILKSVP
ncbi:MAG: hypothetical protein WBB28_01520 [Crinalium sp.]